MRYLSCCYFFVFISLFSFGQEIALLEKKLENANTDVERGQIMCDLSLAYCGIDSVKVFAYAKEALAIFQRSHNPYGIGQAYLSLGGGYFDYDDLEQAKRYYKLAKAQFETLLAQDSSIQNKKAWVKSTFNLSATLGRQELNEEALAYVMEAEPVARRTGDSAILAMINSNLGITFTNLEQFDKAYYYFSQSKQFYQDTTTSQFIQDRLIFSFCLYGMDSLSRMKEVLNQIKYTLDRAPGAVEWHLYHLARGKYLSGRGQYEAALAHYDTSSVLIEKTKMVGHLKSLYRHYAEIYEKLGDYTKAKYYVLRYLEEGQKDADPEDELLAIQELAKYEARQENHEQAYAYLNRYILLKDSLNLTAMKAQFNELELKYQTEKKERAILALERQNSEAALALEKKRSQHYLMLLVVGSLAFLLVAGYVAYRHKQRQALIIDRERTDEMNQLKHEQQTKVLSALIEGQEKERKRLATDLHDGLGGRLSGISLKLSKLDKDDYNGPINHQIKEILGNMNHSLAELRGIARNLTPETLSNYGLKAALEDYCSSLDRKDSKIILQFYGSETKMEENSSLTIYRIIQELINNAVKHAQATEILVQYIREGNKIDITVEDDGVGFCTDRPYLVTRMGLTNIKTRVTYLNGKMDLQSLANEGTTVNIQIDV